LREPQEYNVSVSVLQPVYFVGFRGLDKN